MLKKFFLLFFIGIFLNTIEASDNERRSDHQRRKISRQGSRAHLARDNSRQDVEGNRAFQGDFSDDDHREDMGEMYDEDDPEMGAVPYTYQVNEHDTPEYYHGEVKKYMQKSLARNRLDQSVKWIIISGGLVLIGGASIWGAISSGAIDADPWWGIGTLIGGATLEGCAVLGSLWRYAGTPKNHGVNVANRYIEQALEANGKKILILESEIGHLADRIQRRDADYKQLQRLLDSTTRALAEAKGEDHKALKRRRGRTKPRKDDSTQSD